MTIDWQRFTEIVHEGETFLLTSHMRADCDAVGSELAMADALKSLGKQVRVVNADPVPPHIAFIDPNQEIESLELGVDANELREVDVLIVLDTSAWSQLGPMADVLRSSVATKVVIDHHVSDDHLATHVFKDSTAEATGRLVLEAIDALQVELTPAMATPLFAAIATDTGWFRFASVSDKTFAAASRLVTAGAKPTSIFSSLYEQHSFARIQLQGRILGGAKLDLGGRLVYSSVTQADLAELGAEPTDTEDVINRLLSVKGVEVALLFLELEAAKTKVSLRSRSSTDVRQIAALFGGGGHTAAAGVRYPGSLPDAESAVLDAVRKAMG